MEAKKIIPFLLVVICSISFFGSMPETKAVSYNGSATYAIPNIQTSTGETIIYYQSAPNFPNLSAYLSGGSDQAMQMTLGFRITSGSTFSGMLQDITFCRVSYCGGAGDEVHTRFYIDSALEKFYIEFDQSPYPILDPEVIGSQTFPGAFDGCVGDSSDCLIVFVIGYVNDSGQLYVNSVRSYYYYDDTRQVEIRENTTTGVIETTGYYMHDPASIVNMNGISSSGGITAWNWFASLSSPYLADPGIVRDYLSGFTATGAGRSFTTTFPLYTYSSGIVIEETDGPSGGAFDDCSYLEIGCYIDIIWTKIIDWLFPDINFAGNTSTCLTGTTAFATGGITEIGYFQKIVNLFVLVIPVPPTEGTDICIISSDTQVEVTYRRSMSGMTSSGVITSIIPTIGTTPSPTTGFDTILIFVFACITACYIYFLNHNKHD